MHFDFGEYTAAKLKLLLNKTLFSKKKKRMMCHTKKERKMNMNLTLVCTKLIKRAKYNKTTIYNKIYYYYNYYFYSVFTLFYYKFLFIFIL